MPNADESPPDILAEITWLRGLASHIVADRARRDDVIQEAALAALGSAERGRRRSPEGLRKWLGGVVRNVHRSQLRRDERLSRRERDAARAEATAPTDDLAARAELSKALLAAVLELPPPMREAVLLRHFEGLTPHEIAERTSTPGSTVRARLTRAHQKLRARLEDEYGGSQGLALALIPLADPAALAVQLAGATTAALPAALSLWFIMTSKAALALLTAIVLIGGAGWLVTQSTHGPERTNQPSRDHAQAPTTSETAATPLSTVAATDGRVDAKVDPKAASGPVRAPVRPPVAAATGYIVGELHVTDVPVRGALIALDENVPRSLARMGVLEGPAPESSRTTSGSDGRFRIEVRPGVHYRLRIEHAAHAPLFVPDTVAGDLHRLQLDAGGALALLVVDANGAPLSKIDCRVVRNGTGFTRSATTDEHGEVTFDRLPIGEVRATAQPPHDSLVRASRHVRIAPGLTHLRVDGGLTPLRLTLVPAAVLLGEVRDQSTGAPIEGAQVSLYGRAVSTGADGTFRLGGFLPGAEGSNVLETSAPGYRPAATEFIAPKEPVDSPLLIELTPGQRGHLRVVDASGASIAGAQVTATTLIRSSQFAGSKITMRSVSDGDGVVRFDTMAHGAPHEVVAVADGYGAGVRIVVPNPAEGSSDLGEIYLSAACTIGGRLAPGLEPSGVVLLERFEGNRSMHVGSQLAGPDGQFEFGGIAAGEWRLAYYPRGKEGFALARTALCFQTVSVRPGERREGLVLSPGETFQGRAVNESGGAVSKLTVLLAAADGTQVEGPTNEQGEFTLPLPGDGPFTLEVIDLRLSYAPWKNNVSSSDSPLTIELAPLSTEYEIVGRLVMSSGEPLPKGLYVHFTHAPSGRSLNRVGVPNQEGWFTMKNLDDVAYDLSLVDFDKRFEPISIEGATPGTDDIQIILERK